MPATPVSTESARMALMSTNACAPQDIQVYFAGYPSNMMKKIYTIIKWLHLKQLIPSELLSNRS